MTAAESSVHAFVVHVFGSTVVVVPVVVSLSVTVAQSYVTVSGQVILYQSVSWEVPEGAVKLWVIVLAPFVGLVLPRRAA